MGFENIPVRWIANKMSKEVEIKVQGSPREEFIRTAVNFLNSPRVQQSPAIQKEEFLKKKGLTTEEIKIAFEKSRNFITVPNIYESHLADGRVQSQNLTSVFWVWLGKFRDALHAIALLFGVTYGFYYLYKKLVESTFFRKGKKPKSFECSFGDLNKTLEESMGTLKSDMEKVRGDLERISSMQSEAQFNTKYMHELKSEIATVKGILLSRNQFSSVNLPETSIPAWQLTQKTKDDKESSETEDAEHNSGSSETDIVAHSNSNVGSQGSDSSLEMIKVDNQF